MWINLRRRYAGRRLHNRLPRIGHKTGLKARIGAYLDDSTTMPSFIYGHTRSPWPLGEVELGERCVTALRADLSRFVGEAI
jgi:hypothetical protein